MKYLEEASALGMIIMSFQLNGTQLDILLHQLLKNGRLHKDKTKACKLMVKADYY